MIKIFFTLTALILFSNSSFLMANEYDHSHKAFDSILKKIVISGNVNYKSLKKDRDSLNQYLGSLSSVSEKDFAKFSEKEQLAFLINAYNAFTLDLIVKNYPVKSIGDIGGPVRMVNLARGTPWKKFTFSFLGKERNLDWIEHGKLRVSYKEPRIHFAINCASIGCPLLKNEAYTAGKLESQLTSATKGFLSEKNKNRYDAKSNTLHLSKIFDWFADDFIKDSGSVLKFVQKYSNEKIAADAKIKYTDYDWSLNEAR
ncbi:MAG: DUF547 domain-containing protein [Leptospira sp.]|nr:DUF547 domain-containing protein [Leptospira sp.]